MEKLIAACGLDCAACDIYQVTVANDDAKRVELAKAAKEHHNMDVKPEDINCVGCRGEGSHLDYCSKCSIRSCADSKGYGTCAECPEYGCETLTRFTNMVPKAKQNLEALRA